MADIDAWNILAVSNSAPAPDGAPEGSLTFGQINNVMREMMAVLARWYEDTGFFGVTTNSGNDYSVTIRRTTVAAYAEGLVVALRINATNTGNVTLNVNSIGAKSVRYPDTGQVAAGEWGIYRHVIVAYDATNDWFQVVSPLVSPTRIPLAAAGDLLYHNGTSMTRLPAGAVAGTYLRSYGTSLGYAGISASEVTVAGIQPGDMLQAVGGSFSRVPIGPALYLLRANAGATGVEYRAPHVYELLPQNMVSATGYAWAIPAGAREISVGIHNASVTGSDRIIVRLATSGGPLTSGYSGYCGRPGISTIANTTGFELNNDSSPGASALITGQFKLISSGFNSWTFTSQAGTITNYPAIGFGSILLPSALTEVSIVVSGSNTFDSGFAAGNVILP